MKVAVIGGSGFVGRHVVAELVRGGHEPVIVSRPHGVNTQPAAGRRGVDITTGATGVLKAIDGCGAVVNASSYVGDEEQLQVAVNVDGVANIVDAVATANVPLVHVSTAGVYGRLPFDGGAEGQYAIRPESSLSRTRARGDAIAVDTGASVLRPLFISGVGDRRFLLHLLHAHVALGGWIDDGRALLSVVSVDLVARAAVATVERRIEGGSAEVVHVVTDRPIATRELLAPTLTAWGALPARSLSAEDAAARLVRFGIDERKVAQFTRDYVISSDRMQRLVGASDLHSRAVTEAALAWYADQRPR